MGRGQAGQPRGVDHGAGEGFVSHSAPLPARSGDPHSQRRTPRRGAGLLSADPAAARKDKYAAHVSQTNVKAHHLASTSPTSEPLSDPTATRSHPSATVARASG